MNQDHQSNEHESETGAPQEPMKRHPCVADIMTRKTITLNPHHGLTEVVSLMADRHFRHVVVVDTAGRIVGVVSDRDVLRALSRTSNWQTKDVGQIMTRDPFTVKGETLVSVAVAKIVSKRINCLPVLDDEEKICGIVTSTDLLKAYQKLLESLEHAS